MISRGYIRKHKYDTSYNCLARRAAKNNNILNRIVRRGSVAWRIGMYGEVLNHKLNHTVSCI